eukprot:TRINITY_DN4792_c0_g1_i1.p1 TRINITY_DN4792_c0_g1~~TRINITY_DN4792_c0_g1_i1.p1  ORF type:complete len:300 (+),score=137.08 TRINITY_DN4792_c0_g1_i1:218-1117(+)
MAWFGLQPGATVLLEFDGAERRPSRAPPPGDKKALERVPIFVGNEPVSGAVTVLVAPGKKVDHMGIKVEMIGQIELYYDRGNHYKFSSLVRELDTANSLVGNRQFLFDFSNVDKPYESYSGLNVRLRYFVRVTITRNYGTITKDFEFAVQNVEPEEPVMNPSLKMEVGIEECLHIEFEYDKSKYHLRDVIIGKIYFLLVRIKIKHMELAVVRREAAGSGATVYNESETVVKYEVMDGAPVKGECVPLRLFLKPYDLTPTYKSINNKFSVRYYLNLVLVDEEDRRYFKQQEVVLWRRDVG